MDSVWFEGIVIINQTLYLATVLLSVFVFAISWRIKGFHDNLTAVIQFTLFMLIIGCVARFILATCKIYGIVPDYGFFAAALINTSVLLRAAHSYSFCFSLASVAAERSLATYFLSDYEQRSRRVVRVLLISVSSSVALVLGGVSVLRDLTDIDLPYVTTIIISSTIVICYLYWYNYRKMMLSTKWKLPYTLSLRFQLQENIRVFKMLRYVYLAATVTAFMSVGLLFASIKCESQECSGLVDVIYSLEVSICGCIIVIVFAMSVPQWRVELRKLLFLRTRNSSIQDVVTSGRGKDASAIYFKQLKSSWY